MQLVSWKSGIIRCSAWDMHGRSVHAHFYSNSQSLSQSLGNECQRTTNSYNNTRDCLWVLKWDKACRTNENKEAAKWGKWHLEENYTKSILFGYAACRSCRWRWRYRYRCRCRCSDQNQASVSCQTLFFGMGVP